MATPKTLFDKIWDTHLVNVQDDGTCLIYIDRHLIHEVTSPQAFEGLRDAGREPRRPDLTLAVVDHDVPTTDRTKPIEDDDARLQIEALRKNCAEYGIQMFDIDDIRQGIVHVMGDADLPAEEEKELRRKTVLQAIEALKNEAATP